MKGIGVDRMIEPQIDFGFAMVLRMKGTVLDLQVAGGETEFPISPERHAEPTHEIFTRGDLEPVGGIEATDQLVLEHGGLDPSPLAGGPGLRLD